MPHALTVLFEALRLYRTRSPERARRLRFFFVGTSYAPPGEGRASVLPLAEKHDVADQVDELPHRVGYLECLRLQQEADVLLLPGSSDCAYSPSKIYPYYLAERPILALVFESSVMEKILRELACATLVVVRDTEPHDIAVKAIMAFFESAVLGRLNRAPRNDVLFQERYLTETLTRRQCELFDAALTFSP